MEKALLVIVQVVLFPTIPGLFTVEMTNNSYLAEIGGVITMECRFPAEDGVILSGLNVHWHRIQSSGSLEVYRLVNGQEDLTFQHSQYKGRVCLQKEKLPMGLAVLQISNLSISDSGKYRCLIELGGADYKEFTLTVRAAYKPIKKDIRKTEEDNMVELSCQSEGYPLTSVLWRDATGKKLSMKANTTYFKTVKHLFHLSSQVIITTTNNNTYTCTFLDEAGMGFSASFKIPDDLRNSTDFHLDYRNRNTLTTVMAILISALILTVVVAIVAYHRLKGLFPPVVVEGPSWKPGREWTQMRAPHRGAPFIPRS
ncbi:programmed cell death 1 ligand 1 isoform X2 [Amia ocellicauda]